jgi:putative membrane protein
VALAMSFVIRLIVNAAALWVATQLVSGVVFTGDWLTLLAVALVFGIVNAIVRPVTKLVTFPVIILTLGLFLLVINGLMLMLTSAVSGWLGLGFDVRGFGAAFWGALVVSLLNGVVWLLVRDRDKRPT